MMRPRRHEAIPTRSGLLDLKQDAGGMIDIEFIVQYLVLRVPHASVASPSAGVRALWSSVFD